MSASDHLSQPLFHGSIHPFKVGDVIKPQNQGTAFATPDANYAGRYAEAGNMRAFRNSEDKKLNVNDNPALFGTVYKVEPVKHEDVKHGTSTDIWERPIVASESGFKVTGISHLTSPEFYDYNHTHTFKTEGTKVSCSECKKVFNAQGF